MNIGFDAKRYFHNPTGLGNYSRTLVNGLAQLYPQHQYFLFNPKPSQRFAIPAGLPLKEVQPHGFFSKKLPGLWRSRGMIKDLLTQNINLYHGLSHEVPVGIAQSGIRSVVTVHDLIFERYPHQYGAYEVRMHRGKIKYACQQADGVIAISEQTRRDLVHFYKVPEHKIFVCYQSCDPIFSKEAPLAAKDAVRRAYALPPEFFLYVGSITERKNLLGICQGMKAAGKHLKLPLVVVGNGNGYAKKVISFLEGSGMQNRVIFLKNRTPAEAQWDVKHTQNLATLYQMARALVYPSYFEGFGIPVLEALWSRTPVITASTSCLPETAGDAALYVNPANEKEIGAAMVQLQNSPDLCAALKEKGWAQAQKFTLERCTAQVMEVYQKITEHGSI